MAADALANKIYPFSVHVALVYECMTRLQQNMYEPKQKRREVSEE